MLRMGCMAASGGGDPFDPYPRRATYANNLNAITGWSYSGPKYGTFVPDIPFPTLNGCVWNTHGMNSTGTALGQNIMNWTGTFGPTTWQYAKLVKRNNVGFYPLSKDPELLLPRKKMTQTGVGWNWPTSLANQPIPQAHFILGGAYDHNVTDKELGLDSGGCRITIGQGLVNALSCIGYHHTAAAFGSIQGSVVGQALVGFYYNAINSKWTAKFGTGANNWDSLTVSVPSYPTTTLMEQFMLRKEDAVAVIPSGSYLYYEWDQNQAWNWRLYWPTNQNQFIYVHLIQRV